MSEDNFYKITKNTNHSHSVRNYYKEVYFMKKIKAKPFTGQQGQGLTEYAIILSLVAVGCIAIVGLFTSGLKEKIAALSYAVTGNSSNAKSADKKALDMSNEAQKNADKKKGNTKIDESVSFD